MSEAIEAWNAAIEKEIRTHDLEAQFEQLIAARDEPDFDDRLKAAIVEVYRKGSLAGVAAAGSYFHAILAEGK